MSDEVLSYPWRALKGLMEGVATVLVSPLTLVCAGERWLAPNSEVMFHFSAHSLALGPCQRF